MTNSKKFILFFIVVGVTFTGLVLAKDRFFLFDEPQKWPATYKNNKVTYSAVKTKSSLPSLPDISRYTPENLLRKKPHIEEGRVSVLPFQSMLGMDKFFEIRRLVEFSNLQKTNQPQAITIQSGVYTMDTLTKAVNDASFLEKKDNEYILKRPIYIDSAATLIIEGTDSDHLTLKMSSTSGGFIVNAGHIFILHADVSGWNEATDDYSTFEVGQETKFRPFFVTWSGSESYFYDSVFRSMGYHISKSYGIAFSTSKAIMEQNPNVPAPKGWLLNNTFEDMYYGFYSYEAEDVVLLHNTYKNNIIYGIDPHDRSKRLIIAKNVAYGTHKKHGIIVSREVDDSWIFDNICFLNKGSGFMLDRTSVRNIVANNYSFLNGNDGLTLFESQDNKIHGNKLFLNGRSGYRLRNSWNLDASNNVVLFNYADGVQSYGFDIRKTELKRDFVEDPFTQRSSLNVVGDTIFGNLSGTFKIYDSEQITLSDVEYGFYWENLIRGDAENLGRAVARGLAASPSTVVISKDSSLIYADEPADAPQQEKKSSDTSPSKSGDVMGDLNEDGGSEE